MFFVCFYSGFDVIVFFGVSGKVARVLKKACFFSSFFGFVGWLILVDSGLEGLGVFCVSCFCFSFVLVLFLFCLLCFLLLDCFWCCSGFVFVFLFLLFLFWFFEGLRVR